MRRGSLIFAVLLTAAAATAQKGLLNISVTGLPSGQDPKISITGPQGFSKTISQSQALRNLAPGTYHFISTIVIHRQAPISQAFRLDNLEMKIGVNNDTQRVNLNYRLMPGSDKLWMGNQNAVTNTSTRIIAFNEDAIHSSRTSTATVKLTSKGTSPKGMAFDPMGNLWIADAYTVRMYAWRELGNTNLTPSVTLTTKEPSPCVAFDAAGNLWISDGRKVGTIFRIPSSRLLASGPASADIILSGSGVSGADNMVFDQQGNLWTTHEEKKSIVKVSAAAIRQSSTAVEASFRLNVNQSRL